MSIWKDVTVFFASILFTMALLSAIYSYTLGDLIQRENFENFMKSEVIPELVEEQCTNLCSDYNETETCLEACTKQVTNDTEMNLQNSIGDIYERDVLYGYRVQDLLPFFRMENFIYSLIVSIALGCLLMLMSDCPMSSLGKSMITISTALFIMTFLIDFIVPVSNASYQTISGYLGEAVGKQTLIATILLVAGIALVLTNYCLDYRNKRKVKRKK